MNRQRGWQAAVKRGLDIAVAVTALVLLWPIMLLAAACVRLTIGSPVLFKQPRPGKGGKIFTLYKFRTMLDPRTRNGRPLTETERVTPLGRFLRRTNIDELPQLWNILRGEMSLVGPRPLLPQYLPRYSPCQARRHEVTPGLTGLVAVKGRNLLTWEEKFELDVEYVDNWSFWLDVKILAMTALKVITNEGGRPPNAATVEEFMGSAPKPSSSGSVANPEARSPGSSATINERSTLT